MMENELAKEELEIQQMDNQIDSGLDAVATLEAYGDLLKQSGTDGISKQTAAILNIGLSNCYKALGLENLSTGLESHVTCTSRDGLLKVEFSFESISDKIKAGVERIWEWIIERLKKLKAWYDNFGRKVKKIKAEAEDLGKIIKSGKGDEGAEFEMKGYTYFRLKPYIVNNQLVNEATTEVYKWMHKFSRDYPKAINGIIPGRIEVAKNGFNEESYKVIVDVMSDIELENNFSLSNVRLEDNVIVADFETVPAEDIGKIIMKVRNKNAITDDLEDTESILERINDLFGHLDDLSESMTKQIQGLEDTLEEDDVHIVLHRNRLIVNNLINNPALRKTLLGYIEYLNLKLTVIRREVTTYAKEFSEKE